MSRDSLTWMSGSQPFWRTSELVEQGLNKRQVSRLVSSGALVKVHRGCYADGESWNRFSPSQQALQRILAHHHAGPITASLPPAYSHTSAARLHQLQLWNVDDRIHLTQSVAGTARDHSPQVIRHFARLAPDDVTVRSGLPTTELARTVIDCARLLPYRQSLIIADQGLRKGVSCDRLAAILSQLRGHKGVQMARRVVANASGSAESPGESLTRCIVSALPIPAPKEQLVVFTRHGEHRLDFGWEEQKLALEFDGKTKYFDYAPTSEVLFQERRREKALMEEGWRFIRIEWRDLFQESALRSRILGAWHGARGREGYSLVG